MKLLHALVGLSVVANVGMAVWLLRSAPPAVAAEKAPLARAPAGEVTKQLPAASSAVAPSPRQNFVAPPWTEVQRGSLESLVAELRAKGFPPVAIRAAAKARIKADLASEYKTVCDALASAAYWRNDSGLNDLAIDRARRLLDREVDDRAMQLLGLVESELSPEMQAASRRMYGNIPAEKLRQVMRINADYAELTYHARAESQGVMLPEDTAKMRILWDEQRADIDRVLTPEERLEYDYYGSSTANRLRARLVTFQPTEAEFQAIFKVERTLDLQFPSSSSSSDQIRQRATATRDLEPQIAKALGPQRYAEYIESGKIRIPIKK